MSKLTKKEARIRRHRRLRNRVTGTAEVPRMCVCRTDAHLYVQFVDDSTSSTLAQASSLDPSLRSDKTRRLNCERAAALGKLAADRAKEKNISKVVFDRGGFRYHGRIQALADAARENGLEF